MRTYTIELRVDFEDEAKHDAILQATREAARSLITVAMLLKDKREPRIMMQAGDMFCKDEDVKLFAENEEASAGE